MSIMNANIITLLSANGRRVLYEYKVLDHNLNDKQLNIQVNRCKVRYSSLDDIKQYAEIEMVEHPQIDYDNDYIQIYCNVFIPKYGLYRYSLGVFCLTSPKREIKSNVVYRNVQAQGLCKILHDRIINQPYRLPAGTNVRNAVLQLINSTNVSIPQSDATLPRDRDFGAGNTSLSLINTLLSDYMNCTSLYVNPYGVYTAREYVDPLNRTVDYEYDSSKCACIEGELSEYVEISSIPNRFNSYTSSSQEESMYYTYTNDNIESPTSTINRHGRIIDERQVWVDCATYDELINITKKRATDATSAYSKIEWSSKIYPVHGYMDCCYIHAAGITDKFIETSWTIDSKSDHMTHEGRRVVKI